VLDRDDSRRPPRYRGVKHQPRALTIMAPHRGRRIVDDGWKPGQSRRL